MFENNTLVVVGAGASSECKLPMGFDLKARVASLLDMRFPDGSRGIQYCNGIRNSLVNTSPNLELV